MTVDAPFVSGVSAPRARVWRYVALIVVGVVAAVGLRVAGFQALRITSGSMEPSVRTGQWVIARRATSPLVANGRIAVFYFPEHSSHLAIKRIVAGPGDVVDASVTEVKVNGNRIAALPPLPLGVDPPVSPGRLGPGRSYLLGDNLPASIDSRSFGPVEREQLAGSVIAVVPVINTTWLLRAVALCLAVIVVVVTARRWRSSAAGA